MLTVFLLVMYLGGGDDRRPVQTNLHFYSVTECNFFAKELAKRYGNYRYSDFMDKRDRATLYCIPVTVDPKVVEVF
mgnify:FL=1